MQSGAPPPPASADSSCLCTDSDGSQTYCTFTSPHTTVFTIADCVNVLSYITNQLTDSADIADRIEVCGDYNGSGDVNIADAVNLLAVLVNALTVGYVPS